MASSGCWEHVDAHRPLKSCWSSNEGNHDGKSYLRSLLAVLAAPEGMRRFVGKEGAGEVSAGEHNFLII